MRITLKADRETGKFSRRLLREVLAVLLADWNGPRWQVITPIGDVELKQVQPNRVQMIFGNKVKTYAVRQ